MVITIGLPFIGISEGSLPRGGEMSPLMWKVSPGELPSVFQFRLQSVLIGRRQNTTQYILLQQRLSITIDQPLRRYRFSLLFRAKYN